MSPQHSPKVPSLLKVAIHNYGNDQDPQRCSDPPKVTQLVGDDAPWDK